MPRDTHFRDLVTFRMNMLARLSERHAEAAYQRQFGLSLLEARIVGITGGRGRMPFRQLSQELEIDKAQLSRLVSGLIERGLLERTSDPGDQRSKILGLTAEGARTCEVIYSSACARNLRWLEVLSPDELASFTNCLDLLTRRIRTMPVDPDADANWMAPSPVDAAPMPPSGDVRLQLDDQTARHLLGLLEAALADAAPPQRRRTKRTAATSVQSVGA